MYARTSCNINPTSTNTPYDQVSPVLWEFKYLLLVETVVQDSSLLSLTVPPMFLQLQTRTRRASPSSLICLQPPRGPLHPQGPGRGRRGGGGHRADRQGGRQRYSLCDLSGILDEVYLFILTVFSSRSQPLRVCTDLLGYYN